MPQTFGDVKQFSYISVQEYEDLAWQIVRSDNQVLREDPFKGSLNDDSKNDKEVKAESEDDKKNSSTALDIPYLEDDIDTLSPGPPTTSYFFFHEQSEVQKNIENEDRTVPNETTSLLGNGADIDKPDAHLSPSIFTSQL